MATKVQPSKSQDNDNTNNIPSCRQGDSFNIEEWLSSEKNQQKDSLKELLLPSRPRGRGAKTRQNTELRIEINENRIFYEEYAQPFKCIQLFNQAQLEILSYKMHQMSDDQPLPRKQGK